MRLLIDISGLIYRSAYALRLSHRGKPTGAIYGTLKALGHLADIYEPEEMVICWDDGHEHQSRLYPDYKMDRKKDPAFVRDLDYQKAVLRKLLGYLPVINVIMRGIEADDLIAVLAKFLHMEEVGIVTGDTDLYCLSSKRCMLINNDGVKAKLELPASWYVAYKVLVGGEDNIKGVTQIGPVKAKVLLEDHRGDLNGILATAKHLGGLGKDKWPIVKRRVARNLKLMTPGAMLTDSERVGILDQYRFGRLERRTRKAEFREALMESGIVSIVSRLQGYLSPFRKMERHSGQAKAKAETTRADRVQGGAASAGGDQSGQTYTRIVRHVERCCPKVCKVDGRGRGSRAGRIQGGQEGVGSSLQRQTREGLPRTAARATEVLARLRAQAPVGVAAPGDRPGAEGAVYDSHGQARHVRARGDAEAILHHAGKVPQQPTISRSLSVLQMLQAEPGWGWLKSRPSRELQRVVHLINNVLAHPGKCVPLDDEEFLYGLEDAFGNEMPLWMKTDKEVKRDAKNILRNVQR